MQGRYLGAHLQFRPGRQLWRLNRQRNEHAIAYRPVTVRMPEPVPCVGLFTRKRFAQFGQPCRTLGVHRNEQLASNAAAISLGNNKSCVTKPAKRPAGHLHRTLGATTVKVLGELPRCCVTQPREREQRVTSVVSSLLSLVH